MAPAHQHSGALHQSLTPLPTLQFQDVTGPSFLPQALHQQYLLQQQLLEAQHRRLVSHPRSAGVGPRQEGGAEGGRGVTPGARARTVLLSARIGCSHKAALQGMAFASVSVILFRTEPTVTPHINQVQGQGLGEQWPVLLTVDFRSVGDLRPLKSPPAFMAA